MKMSFIVKSINMPVSTHLPDGTTFEAAIANLLSPLVVVVVIT